MPQQQRLGAERLVADRAHELALRPRRRRRLRPLLSPPAGDPAPAQVCLSVIGQAGEVVELLLTLVALVDGAGAVAALVRQQLAVAPENGVALEAGVGSEGVGLREAGFRRRGLVLTSLELGCRDVFGPSGRRGARLVGAEVADHLWTPENRV